MFVVLVLLVVVVIVMLRLAVNKVLGDTGISGYKGNEYCPYILYAKKMLVLFTNGCVGSYDYYSKCCCCFWVVIDNCSKIDAIPTSITLTTLR